ncbi:MAG: hypothetical protein ACK46Q_07440 [Hyphomonas sp.]
MQFKLSKTHRYWWPVKVRMPSPDVAGEFVEMELRLQFEPMPRDEALAEQDQLSRNSQVRDMAVHEEAQFIRVIKNWDDVIDDDGEIVPFSPDKLRIALQQSWFRASVSKALAESMHGEAARLGN